MLSNLETEKEKLIQIILMGQPQLKQKLEHQRLEQFRQRVAVYYHIGALNKEETRDYILHRLKLVSENGCDLFTPAAIDLVFRHSNGIPRIINLVCDSALLSGYACDTKKITEKMIAEVIKERDVFDNTVMMADDDEEEIPMLMPEVAMYCCPDCQEYGTCVIKWERGSKGEAQVCCTKCGHHGPCVENVKKSKLN
jgi:general secretion pathway protein A